MNARGANEVELDELEELEELEQVEDLEELPAGSQKPA